jgi:hypothetical protein
LIIENYYFGCKFSLILKGTKMKKVLTLACMFLVSFGTFIALNGCEKKSDLEKSMDSASKQADESMEDAADKADDMMN